MNGRRHNSRRVLNAYPFDAHVGNQSVQELSLHRFDFSLSKITLCCFSLKHMATSSIYFTDNSIDARSIHHQLASGVR
jgi:hypothetical protein